VASAKASQQASAADLATLTLSIQAELATDYFALRAQDAQQQLLDKTVADYTQSLKLTQNCMKAAVRRSPMWLKPRRS